MNEQFKLALEILNLSQPKLAWLHVSTLIEEMDAAKAPLNLKLIGDLIAHTPYA